MDICRKTDLKKDIMVEDEMIYVYTLSGTLSYIKANINHFINMMMIF
jgi:hypothetical protein